MNRVTRCSIRPTNLISYYLVWACRSQSRHILVDTHEILIHYLNLGPLHLPKLWLRIHEGQLIINKHALLSHPSEMRSSSHLRRHLREMVLTIAALLAPDVHRLLVQQLLLPLLLSQLSDFRFLFFNLYLCLFEILVVIIWLATAGIFKLYSFDSLVQYPAKSGWMDIVVSWPRFGSIFAFLILAVLLWALLGIQGCSLCVCKIVFHGASKYTFKNT